MKAKIFYDIDYITSEGLNEGYNLEQHGINFKYKKTLKQYLKETDDKIEYPDIFYTEYPVHEDPENYANYIQVGDKIYYINGQLEEVQKI